MGVKFTADQRKVIDLRGCNILVSAAAGSGKTAVLVERIVNKICDESKPVDIDRLLVVTFTNAAASEMRERIGAGIAARLEQNPASEHIQRQAALIHNAQITTIDSFCLFLLKNHFQEIGLDPAFRIADEGEMKLLRNEVMQELLEDSFASEREEFRLCVEYFCPSGKESALENAILEMEKYAASFPWPEEWLKQRKLDYHQSETPLEETPEGAFLMTHLRKMITGWLVRYRQLQGICESPDGPYMYGEAVDADMEQLERLLACNTPEELAEKLPAVTFTALSSKRDASVNKEKRALASGLRGDLKKKIQKAGEDFFGTPLGLAKRRAAACEAPVSMLIDLTLEFMSRLAEKKQEKKLVDFSDVEHFALKILLGRNEAGETIPGRVALEYRKHFDEVLIDEYQDSNLVQEYLLSAVSGEEEGNFNRFMVGDVKQSIYKFRLARPELFLEKYGTYTCGEGDRQRIDLSRNFRSRVEVVNSVNSVFERIMSEEVGGIAYDESAALYPGAEYPESTGNATELILAETPGEEAEMDSREFEALVTARRIRELKADFMVTDKESKLLRPVRYSDMVILLRTTEGWDEVFKKVLEQQGIPCFTTSKSGYFGASEVQELLQVLKVIDNPRQDIPLFGMLKSAFGGFTDEELAKFRILDRRIPLIEGLKLYALSGEDRALAEKAAGFLKRLQSYREKSVYLSVRELVTRLVEDYDYLNYVTALPLGGKRRANVEMFFTRASEFEKTSYFGLFHFIRYMEQLEKYEVDFGEAELLDENADVVRIMSIHKSKGLEFPVTFICGMNKQFNTSDLYKSLLLDMDLGLAVDYVDPVRRVTGKTLRKKILSAKLKEGMLAEELRIFYVAMTRAREKLIMTASVKDGEPLLRELESLASDRLTYADFFDSKSYLDFLKPICRNTDLEVCVLREKDVAEGQTEELLETGDRRMLLDAIVGESEADAALQRRLQAVYPFEYMRELYTKTTVSELKIAAMADKDEAAYHSFETKETEEYIPSFRRAEAKISGAVRGNAYHRVMEILDFDALETEGLDALLARQTAENRLPAEYAEIIDRKKILHFLESELGCRMLAAHKKGKLYREQPFVLGISAGRLRSEFPAEEKVLIQGIIDVFWEEDGEIVLLDYKTDSVKDMEELRKRYETQLEYYAEAIEKITGCRVKESYLYSFKLEQY